LTFSLPKRRWLSDPTSELKNTPIHIRVNPQNPQQVVIESQSVPGLQPGRQPEFIVAHK